MRMAEFRKEIGLSKKTAIWLYDNIFNHIYEPMKHRKFSKEDVLWVKERQLPYFSKQHNIKRVEEADYETYIEDNGKVFNYRRSFMEERKAYYNRRNKYMYITLWTDGAHKTYRLARLVGKYFCKKPDGCNVINHIDGNKMNNNASNLEWTTISGNTKHAFDMGLAYNDKGEEDSQSMPIDFYNEKGEFINHYGSMSEAERLTGISKSTIANLAKTPNRISRKYKIKVKYA